MVHEQIYGGARGMGCPFSAPCQSTRMVLMSPLTPEQPLQIRRACPRDAVGLATVMAARGGAPSDYAPAARRLLEHAPVLFLAELTCPNGSRVVGWSGAVVTALRPQETGQWLTAGLTVIPEVRRCCVGRRLLQAVVDAVETPEDQHLYSVVNSRNAPSLELHRSLGFEVVETGPCFAGIEFDGGVGVLFLVAPPGHPQCNSFGGLWMTVSARFWCR